MVSGNLWDREAGVPARSGGRNPVFPGKNTLRRPEGPDFKTPAADLSERARSHAHNQPAVMTVKLIFSSTVLTELTSFPDLGWPELPCSRLGPLYQARCSSVSLGAKNVSVHLSG